MKSIFETGFSGNAAGDGLEGVESEAQETPERSLLNQSRYTCINAWIGHWGWEKAMGSSDYIIIKDENLTIDWVRKGRMREV